MSELHVYCFGDMEWIIAESREDACRIGNDDFGWGIPDDELDPQELPDDAFMSVWLDPDTVGVSDGKRDDLLVWGQMSVWAEAFGRGWLCGSEY